MEPRGVDRYDQKIVDNPELSFHPEAAKRFDERTRDILATIQGLRLVPNSEASRADLHPAHVFQSADVISAPKFTFHLDEAGEVVGVTWKSENMWVGWTGEAFQPVKSLVEDIASKKPFSQLVSARFLLEEVCNWLSETLARTRDDHICQYIAGKSIEAVEDCEIWVPLFQTYSSKTFKIADVEFKTFTHEIMEEWWNRRPAQARQDKLAESGLNRIRSELQGLLAASVRVCAERYKAAQIAYEKADNATSLLRFLAPANLNSRLISCCRPLARGAVFEVTKVFMNGGRIGSISRGVINNRNTAWHLDESVALRPGLLENIQRLASDSSTPFSSALYDALILYSRQPLAIDVADKLVFTLSALESMLLKDGNESIQQNLGERMAFLIGQNSQERMDIVKNVREVYGIRSAFVHHGETPRHVSIVDKFLVYAWTTFSRLMDLSVQYKTKAALIGALDDRKMS